MIAVQHLPEGSGWEAPIQLPMSVHAILGVVFAFVFLTALIYYWVRTIQEIRGKRIRDLWSSFVKKKQLGAEASTSAENPAPHAPPRPRPLERKPFERTLDRVAEAVEGRRWENSVVFTSHQRRGRIYLYGPGERGWRSGCTSVQLDVRGVSPGCFRVVSRALKADLPDVHGGEEISIGELEFDAAFVVQARPESLGPRYLSGERGLRLRQAVARIPGMYSLDIDLTKETLYVRIMPCAGLPEPILDLVKISETLLDMILERDGIVGITWVEGAGSSPGQCQVCGGDLRSDVVRCRACETPHHRDCWEYNRVCSTYACQCLWSDPLERTASEKP